jgi:hypothetical protein
MNCLTTASLASLLATMATTTVSTFAGIACPDIGPWLGGASGPWHATVATDAAIGRLRSLPRSINDLDTQALSTVMGRLAHIEVMFYRELAPQLTGLPAMGGIGGMGGMQDESIALERVRPGVAALSDLETVAALRQSLAS